MKTRNLLLFAFCFSLIFTACSRRLHDENSQPATPAPAQNSIATTAPLLPTAIPTTAMPADMATIAPTEVQATTQPPTITSPTATPPPADTAVPESDPNGDELENLLQQLDDANTAAEQDIQNLPNP